MAGCDLHSHHLLCVDFVIFDRCPLIDTISSHCLARRFIQIYRAISDVGTSKAYRLKLLIFLIRFFSDLCSSMKYHPYSIS